ncbi:glycosyltransferase involved in cell wall biosynthesis [Salinibacter ruber]|uniref:Glycosyltransferase involved in cell wall biosynthesis n=1 Tax=Salinibacter ruber TaxID=146919 RepID=A0A9X2R6X6_9BACT|nr:glycosyltransferase family 4 protein [Salinibacter ruber]MCS3857808.1 glycosyltransferase involved in cell wall biosynthesis [Salinibacter ruber]MCS3864634.1 glycosyltransferase involved in cell wall biosynthesis [Salinibacter ruber]
MDEDAPRITLVTEYFYPEEASTAQLLTSLATGLQGDFDVSVLTGRPNYHPGDETESVPTREQHKGVSIERLPATRLDKDTLPFRVVNWITFTLLVFWRLIRTRDSDDVVLVLSNPPLLPLAAWAAKRLCGISYGYLIYDMYPDFPVALGMISEESIVARWWERVMRMIYRDADQIVVLGDSMKRRLTSKMDDDPVFSPNKVEVIPNWEDGDFIEPMPKPKNSFAQKEGLTDSFVLLYSGNIGRFHELRTAIDAIGLLEERGRDDIEFVIIGEGARKADHQRYVEQRGIRNVRFLPFQPMERLPETLTACNASLVGIIPEVEGMCVSSKLYSALAAGRPILAVVGEEDEVARAVREHDCGAYVRPGDAKAAAETLAEWADNSTLSEELGEHARTSFESHYTRSHAVDAYRHLFNQMHNRS